MGNRTVDGEFSCSKERIMFYGSKLEKKHMIQLGYSI